MSKAADDPKLPLTSGLVRCSADKEIGHEPYAYPAPVAWYETSSQGSPVRMAYLDVRPTSAANGTTVVLLHGKNFWAATWIETARALATDGYRVIAPDQVSFCKSSKPNGYQYSFHTLSELTRGLLDRAGVGKIVLVGHSTGGILAVRFALLHPERVSRLVRRKDLGHAPQVDAPAAFLSSLRSALRSNANPTPGQGELP